MILCLRRLKQAKLNDGNQWPQDEYIFKCNYTNEIDLQKMSRPSNKQKPNRQKVI